MIFETQSRFYFLVSGRPLIIWGGMVWKVMKECVAVLIGLYKENGVCVVQFHLLELIWPLYLVRTELVLVQTRTPWSVRR